MAQIPSIKMIRNRLGEVLAYEHKDVLQAAKDIRNAMETRLTLDALHTIDEILSGYGVEIVTGNWVSRYYQDINLEYVNMGDSYTPTVLFDTLKQKFIVCSLGDYVERYPRRFRD